jgi:hypothetical protein
MRGQRLRRRTAGMLTLATAVAIDGTEVLNDEVKTGL